VNYRSLQHLPAPVFTGLEELPITSFGGDFFGTAEDYRNADNLGQHNFDDGTLDSKQGEDDVESESNKQCLFNLDLEGSWEPERPPATTSQTLAEVDGTGPTQTETSWHDIHLIEQCLLAEEQADLHLDFKLLACWLPDNLLL
jgi:hypothetical protein